MAYIGSECYSHFANKQLLLPTQCHVIAQEDYDPNFCLYHISMVIKDNLYLVTTFPFI